MTALDVGTTSWLVRARPSDVIRGLAPGTAIGTVVFAPLLAIQISLAPSPVARIPIAFAAAALFIAGGAFVDRPLFKHLLPRASSL